MSTSGRDIDDDIESASLPFVALPVAQVCFYYWVNWVYQFNLSIFLSSFIGNKSDSIVFQLVFRYIQLECMILLVVSRI